MVIDNLSNSVEDVVNNSVHNIERLVVYSQTETGLDVYPRMPLEMDPCLGDRKFPPRTEESSIQKRLNTLRKERDKQSKVAWGQFIRLQKSDETSPSKQRLDAQRAKYEREEREALRQFNANHSSERKDDYWKIEATRIREFMAALKQSDARYDAAAKKDNLGLKQIRRQRAFRRVVNDAAASYEAYSQRDIYPKYEMSIHTRMMHVLKRVKSAYKTFEETNPAKITEREEARNSIFRGLKERISSAWDYLTSRPVAKVAGDIAYTIGDFWEQGISIPSAESNILKNLIISDEEKRKMRVGYIGLFKVVVAASALFAATQIPAFIKKMPESFYQKSPSIENLLDR